MKYSDFKTMSPSLLSQWRSEVAQCVSELQQLQCPKTWTDIPNGLLSRSIDVAMAYVIIRPFLNSIKSYPVTRALRLLSVYLNEALAKSSALKTDVSSLSTQNTTPVLKVAKAKAFDFERPKHLDDYLYMLPEPLKERAAVLPNLYLDLAAKRNDSERLASEYILAENNGDTLKLSKISPSLAKSNKELVDIDCSIRSFWRSVDTAVDYYKINKVVIDSVSQPTESKQSIPDFASFNKRPSEFTYEEISSMTEPEKYEFYKAQRINANKKYLRRTDMEQNDAWKKQVAVRFNELLKWNVPITKKVRETAISAGVYE